MFQQRITKTYLTWGIQSLDAVKYINIQFIMYTLKTLIKYLIYYKHWPASTHKQPEWHVEQNKTAS